LILMNVARSRLCDHRILGASIVANPNTTHACVHGDVNTLHYHHSRDQGDSTDATIYGLMNLNFGDPLSQDEKVCQTQQ
jgi:hypothetical protein